MKGLKKIAGESKSLKGFYGAEYMQINYNRETGEAWADYFYSIGHNSRKEYHDSNIVTCGFIHKPVTMNHIKKMILDSIA